jgi:hypothetical protein
MTLLAVTTKLYLARQICHPYSNPARCSVTLAMPGATFPPYLNMLLVTIFFILKVAKI